MTSTGNSEIVIEQMDVHTLIWSLKQKNLINDNIEEKLRAEDVDGATLLDLNSDELKSVGFETLGQLKAIQQFVNGSHKTDVCPSALSSDESLTSAIPKFENLKRDILNKHGGIDVIEQIETLGFLDVKHNIILIKICTDILVENAEKCGYKKFYPPKEMKIEMAKAMINALPALKSTILGSSGYEHFFDEKCRSGYLENRLKTLRRKLPVSSKAYKLCEKRKICNEPSSSSSNISDTSSDSSLASTVDIRDTAEMAAVKQKIMLLKEAVPSEENKAEIYAAMEETRDYRRQEIDHDKPSITAILKSYPRFGDIDNCKLLDVEFFALHPKSVPLMESFVPMVPRLLEVAKKSGFTSCCVDENLQALKVLQKLLPPSNTKKCKGCAIIEFQGEGINPQEFATVKLPCKTQPFLLAIGSSMEPKEFHLILDNIALPLGNDALTAFSRLFYCFWVFGINYCPRLITFFNIFEVFVMNATPKSSVRQLLVSLNCNDL